MSFKESKNLIIVLLIASTILTSCGKKSANMRSIDYIMPEYRSRMYTVADLIPFSYNEVRNAQATYGKDLADFFYKEISSKSALARTREEDENFRKELYYRDHNYRILRERNRSYAETNEYTRKEALEKRDKEYEGYYALLTADGGATIKKYNAGHIYGMPVMSIRMDLSKASISDLNSLYFETECEIYRPIVMDEEVYKKLELEDEVLVTIPVVNSTVNKKETKEVKCKYIAKNTMEYTDTDGTKKIIYIAENDGLNLWCRRLLDGSGKTLEFYEETKKLQFLQLARYIEYYSPTTFMHQMSQYNSGNDTSIKIPNYELGKLVIPTLGGGYLEENYKDYIYANSVTTNLKGYVTGLANYTNQAIEINHYVENNVK